jgi:acyl CoA:acetate/3-ketoacid CoA transferase beta subunit
MAKTSRADQMVVAMAREVQDGDFWAQGIATPMVFAALALAKRTHAPRAHFGYAIGGSFSAESGKLSLTWPERVSVGKALRFFSFAEATGELLPHARPKEFLRPAQVDATGATNNVCLGPYERPKLRLPGVGGISDVSVVNERLYLYLPRHSSKVFVARLDFKSGIGHGAREEGVVAPGPAKVFTDLGVFGFEDDRMCVHSLHDGVTPDEVRQKTGFELVWPKKVPTTPAPTAKMLKALHEVDPLGLRGLEALGTKERLLKLFEILENNPEA